MSGASRVARCPVTLFEAIIAGPWRLCPAIGELHLWESAGTLLCQLHDLLDGQVLFQATRPASAYFKLSDRFHVIKLENGTYRGLGFSDAGAANEILEFVRFRAQESPGEASPAAPEHRQTPRVQRALFPAGDVESGSPPPVIYNRRSKSGPLRAPEVLSGRSPQCCHVSPSGTPSPGSSPASVLGNGVTRGSHQKRSISLPKETAATSLPIPATPRVTKSSSLRTPRGSPAPSTGSDRWSEPPPISRGFSPGKSKSALRAKLHKLVLGGKDGFADMEIGFPYNVRHEGHIGWTPPPSASESAWIDGSPSSNFVSPPLSSFGSPGSDELGGNWIVRSPPADFAPPSPPSEYVDERPAEEPSPVTPTRTKRTFSFSRRRNRTQPQALQQE